MNNILPLKIIFLNVYHGDGIVVLFPNKEKYETAMIIDCNDGIKTYNVLKEYGIRYIEAIVISHFHIDHYKGFDILLSKLKEEKIRLKNIFYYPDRIYREGKESKIYGSFLAKIAGMASSGDFVSESNVIDGVNKEKTIYNYMNLRINLIYPRLVDITGEYKINNYSGVVEIKYKNNKVLFTGDLESEGWFKLYNFVKKYKNEESLNVDILKMPHHGAFYIRAEKAMSTREILDIVKPDYAIISTAENKKYKHPNIDTIKELRKNKIKILCTNSTSICGSNCECFGNIIVDIDDNIIIKDYDIKAQKLFCVKNY